MSNNSMLSVKNLSSGYGKKIVICDISLEINANEMVGLLGSNGCGKSTLLKSLCKIISSNGEVRVDGQDVSLWSSKEFAKHCSLVPQKSGIDIDITVLDVVLMGFNPFLSLMGRPTKDMVARALEMLKVLGISDRVYDNYQNLSEGQKQLVIIARALVADTNVLFMDEPESSLDFSVRYDVMTTIRQLVKKSHKSSLVSLHDVNLALEFCDKLLLIKDRRIASSIDVLNEDRESIEHKLNDIYGSVKLLSVANESGKDRLVMVKA